MENLTKSNFDRVMKNKVVFVDFWALWCGPCRALTPIYESVAQKYNDKAVFVKSNVDEERDFALKNGIMSIPCIIAFIDGKPVDKCVGLVSESALCEFVEKHI